MFQSKYQLSSFRARRRHHFLLSFSCTHSLTARRWLEKLLVYCYLTINSVFVYSTLNPLQKTHPSLRIPPKLFLAPLQVCPLTH